MCQKIAVLSLFCFLLTAGPFGGVALCASENFDSTGQSFGRLPLYFIANEGQVDGDVPFYVKGADKTLYFTSKGITYALKGRDKNKSERWVVKLDFVSPNPDVRPRGEDKQEAIFSYFKNKPEDWKTGLPTYATIAYDDLWPGIDLIYSGSVNELKYEFVVEPGADPGMIRFTYRGASEVSVKKTGELEVTTPTGIFEDGIPYAYQVLDGEKKEVSMRYALDEETGDGAVSYGFDLGDYDAKEKLFLDPAVLVYCGYIGGSNDETSNAIAVDGQGNVYVTGYTWSDETTFPVAVGPDLSYNGGTYDAFVAKVNAQGTGLDYCGYIGGEHLEYANSIAVDGQGSAYVTGITFSDETTFPVTVGPDLIYNGYWDAFVAKINAQGTGLDYCGYIGGNNYDSGHGIVVDSLGAVYVTGYARSNEATFPVAVGPDVTHNGDYDVFVAKVNAPGTGLEYCGYIGGVNNDYGYGIALDGQGRAYVTGMTRSDGTTFPVVVGPDLSHGGPYYYYDAFVARVNALGTGLDYCGYIGGAIDDQGNGIAVDGLGNAYVTGDTWSDETTFPVAVGPDLTYNGGTAYGGDAFVAKVNALGTGFDYCGYIGGDDQDHGQGIAADIQGTAYVTGHTWSDETTFPVKVGPDLTHNGYSSDDCFVARVNPQGTGLDYCGYIGGGNDDFGHGIALDTEGSVYVTGQTLSHEANGFPVTVGPDLTYNGGYSDAFVTKVEYTPEPTLTIQPNPLVAGQVGTFAVTNGKPNANTWLVYSFYGPGSVWVPILNVTIDLNNPKLARGPTKTNGNGTVIWSFIIPGGASGLNLWVQGVQYGQTTNVVAMTVQ